MIPKIQSIVKRRKQKTHKLIKIRSTSQNWSMTSPSQITNLFNRKSTLCRIPKPQSKMQTKWQKLHSKSGKIVKIKSLRPHSRAQSNWISLVSLTPIKIRRKRLNLKIVRSQLLKRNLRRNSPLSRARKLRKTRNQQSQRTHSRTHAQVNNQQMFLIKNHPKSLRKNHLKLNRTHQKRLSHLKLNKSHQSRNQQLILRLPNSSVKNQI